MLAPTHREGDTLQVSRRRHLIKLRDNFELLRKPRHPDGSKMEKFDANMTFYFFFLEVLFVFQ